MTQLNPTPRCPGCLHTAARHKRNGGCRSCDCIQSSAPPHVQPNPTPDKNMRPHSRACGWQSHEHGADCASDCPTCHTPAPQPEAHQQYTDSNHVSQSADSDIPKPLAQDGAQVEGLDDEVCRIFSRNSLNPLGTLGAPGVAAALVEISDFLATAIREAYYRGLKDGEHE